MSSELLWFNIVLTRFICKAHSIRLSLSKHTTFMEKNKLEWEDGQIYDNLQNLDQAELAADLIKAVEDNPDITLYEYLKTYEDNKD